MSTSQPPLQFLYHYTNLNGLNGLLASRNLWATDVSFLNDSAEFSHGLKLANGIANAIYEEDDYAEAFGYKMRDAFDKLRPKNLYVTSFSEKPDLLSQWRGYCSGGGGVCLAFDASKIFEFCKNHDMRLERCIYSYPEQVDLIGSLVKACYQRFPQHPMTRREFEEADSKTRFQISRNHHESLRNGPLQVAADEVLQALCDEVSEMIPLFKNNGFHEEAEWRLIAREPSLPENFRVSSNSSYLIPYVELAILAEAPDALQRIIVGPNPNQNRCIASIRRLLDARELHDVQLVSSDIPYNNW